MRLRAGRGARLSHAPFGCFLALQPGRCGQLGLPFCGDGVQSPEERNGSFSVEVTSSQIGSFRIHKILCSSQAAGSSNVSVDTHTGIRPPSPPGPPEASLVGKRCVLPGSWGRCLERERVWKLSSPPPTAPSLERHSWLPSWRPSGTAWWMTRFLPQSQWPRPFLCGQPVSWPG